MNEAEIREALVGKTILDVEFSDGAVFFWIDINSGFFVSARDGVFIGECKQEGNLQ